VAELTGFEVLALIKEIESRLSGTYVNNIYSIGDSQLLRLRKPGGGDVWLVGSPVLGAWVSTRVSERAETTEFTSKLRGELERARFMKARQEDFDRVFELTFGEDERTRRLIIELMPPGNIIVTDGNGRILLLKQEVRSPSRRLRRGLVYVPPAQRRATPASVDAELVRTMVKAEKTVGKAIGKHVSLPRKYIAEVLRRLSLEESAPSSSLQGREEEVADVLRTLVRQAGEGPRPCLCETPAGDEIFAVTPVAFPVKKEAPTVSELCDEQFLSELSKGPPAQPSEEDQKRGELEATVSKLKGEEESLRAEASELRRVAVLAAAAGSAVAARKLLLDAEFTPLKEPNSAAAAASFVFDKAKELDARAVSVRRAMERLTKKVPRSGKGAGPKTQQLPRRKQEWYQKFRWFYTSGGKLAIGGRDAQSNSTLVRRHMDDNDAVYHADLFGSPFFILKGGKEQTEQDVREVAQATVAFSSAWKTGLGTADAYWVDPGQVGTAAPSGEYLARGSFAIKGKKNFVTGNLVEVSVGLESEGRVISGPEAAVRVRVDAYLVLGPHKEKASETAKRVLKDLEILNADRAMSLPTIDDVLRMLPSGGSRVLRRHGGPASPDPLRQVNPRNP
jgi:predicted ribosome quality control (RQC) complex YloA/Tae2 family protein